MERSLIVAGPQFKIMTEITNTLRDLNIDINQGNKTDLMSKFCSSMIESCHSMQELLLTLIPSYYMGLNSAQITEGSGHINDFFNNLSRQLTRAKSWSEIGNLLHESAYFSYYVGVKDKVEFFGPSNDRTINGCLCEYLNFFFMRVYENMHSVREEVLSTISESAALLDICVLSDQQIMDLTSQNLSSITQITLLSKLKRQLHKKESGRFFLHFEFHRTRVYKLDRDFSVLDEWMYNSIGELTDPIYIKNSEQKDGLRKFFLDLMTAEKLFIEDLDYLLQHGFYASENKKPSIRKKHFVVYPGDDITSSEIIAMLFAKLEKLSTKNSKRNIQKWICYLFLNFEGEGYSMHNIKKITDPLLYNR